MKKLLLFLFFAFFALSWQVDAQVFINEDFAGTTGTTPPAGWTNNDLNSSGELWYFNNPGGRTLNAPITDPAAIFDSDHNGSGGAEDCALESPAFDASGVANVTLTFDHYFKGGYGGAYEVEVFNGTTWVSVLSGTASTSDPKSETIDISTDAAGVSNAQVRFHWTGDYSWYWIVDNVKVEAVSCSAPLGLSVGTVTNTTADVSWTSNSPGSTFIVEWRVAGSGGAWSSHNTAVDATSYTITGLTSDTEYEWQLTADCGGSGQSSAVSGPNFYTGYCLSTSTSSSTYTDDFTTTGGSTNISNTSSGYATDGYEDATVMSVSSYESGAFDFSAAFVGTTLGFNIWVDWNDDLDFDDAGEKVYASGSYVSSASGTITVPAGTANGNYRMRTRCDYYKSDPDPCGERTRAETEDYTLTVADPPACPAPSSQAEANMTATTVDLSWLENGSASSWDIELGTTGFSPTGTPTQSSVTNPYTYGGLTSGSTYDWYVRADCGGSYSSWVGPHTFTLVPAPANDDCNGAYVVTVNSDLNCGNTTSGTVEGATQSTEDAAACSGTEDDDVWFKFVATGTTHKIELLNVTGSTTDLYHSVWEGTCPGGLTLVSGTCSDPNSQTVSGLTIGNTYFIRVYTYTSTGGQNTTFDVCVGTPPPPPANDDCDGAYVVTVNSDLNCGSTTSGTVENATQSPEDASACGGTEDDDVWFKFVATATEHKIELLNAAGSTTDLYHSVWEGTCPGGLTLVSGTCSDPNSQTVSGLTVGSTYFIRVYTYTSTGGQNTTFDVCVGTPPPPPANDNCSGAISLIVGNPGDCPTNQVTTDATSATADGNTSCDTYGDNIGVWYSFVAPATGEVVVNYTAGTAAGNPGIVVYDACGGSEVSGTCQDNPATLSNITGLTGGTTYYMLLWFDGASNAGSFDICLEDVGSCPKPTGQTESNITAISADLDWTENGTASTWDIELGTAGFSPTGTPTQAGVTKPYNYGGLTANTSYDWYVRANCGAGSQSVWEGPHTFTTAPPPPANDECSGAIAVTVDAAGAGCPSPTTADNTSATGSEATNGTPSCNDYQGGDVWYSFTAPYGGKVKVVISTNNWSTAAAAIYDDCSSTNEIDCGGKYGTGDFTLEGMTAGNTYYLRMWDYGNNDLGTVDFCLEELPCDIPTGLSVANETTSGADLSWTENGAADHWDLFIVETAVGTVPTASTPPTVDNTTDNPYTWTGGSASTDYDWYVRSDCGASGGSGQSDWSAKGTFTTASADAVDWCNLQWPDQATITAGGSVDVYARVYEPGVTDAAGQGAGITAWIGYSTTDSDPSTWTDWVAATYNVDDGNNDEYQAALGAGLAPGTYYYASRFKLNAGAYKYGGYSASGGGFWDGTTYVSGVLTVNHIDGDLCTDAIALTVNDVCTNTASSNTGATDSGESPAPGCGSYNGADVWFSFVVPASGHVIINTEAGDITDGAMAAYSGTCGALTLIECDDDDGPGTMPMLDLDGLVAGQTIFVRFWEFGGNAFGTFNICVQKGCPNNLVVLPAASASTTSTESCIDGDWTHFYDGTNILLSLKLGSSGAVITNVTVDPDGATDAQWYDNDADGFPSVAGETGAAFMKRKWDVNASTQPSSDVGVRFYYTDDEYNAVNTVLGANGGTALTGKNAMDFYKVTTAEDPFNISPGGIAQGDYELIQHGAAAGINTWVDGTFGTENYAEFNVAGFSGGGAGTGSAGKSIPIELLSFTGYADKDANVLNWTTLSEINTSMFYVERSEFGKEWDVVAKVEASGNSLSKNDYQVTDKEPVTKAFYRLRSVDNDGKYTISKVIKIERKDTGLRLNAVYPNPNDGNFVVNLTSLPGEKGQIELINALGVKVYTKDIRTKGGRTIEKINVNQLPNGVYTLMLEQSGDIITKRVVINK